MFGKLGLHVIKFPVGTFGFVGTVPLALATMVPATTADIMAGRAVEASNGAVVAPKFPTFPTADAALKFAAANGFVASYNGLAS